MFYLYWTDDADIEFSREAWEWSELGPFDSLEEVKEALKDEQQYDAENGMKLRYVIGEFKVIYPEVTSE